MNFILFDEPEIWKNLHPLTLTRPISALRLGINQVFEKWETRLKSNISYLTAGFLSKKFPVKYEEQNIYINSAVLPNQAFLEAIFLLENESCLMANGQLIACKSSKKLEFGFEYISNSKVEFSQSFTSLKKLPDTFLNNASEIKADFEILTQGRKSKTLQDPHVVVYNETNVFIEETASLKACIINAENGPIYIGKNAIVQEGSIIIGPAAVNADAMVAFGARIRPNTTLGPFCRVGGEVGNSIFQGYSNKAHDGFLGNSYIGEWCNLGANTNNSNLKNDYKEVTLYNYNSEQFENTGEVFCGTFMGDYTKAGISTMFNTGTVVGVSSNVYGAGFQEKHIPSFTWGGKEDGYQPYRFEKAIEVINATMARKDLILSQEDHEILRTISNQA
jgi:UDP-N-acetylglucosamine diphosphorylase / glucose-1-phosphate thymidylyltransferase / UDP-N-acetylgalactosamine diphosphorylase / glucosamine-1-phosphate N-acetyltransferase / galactosamine-1-phosphate N-acetyltransferase